MQSFGGILTSTLERCVEQRKDLCLEVWTPCAAIMAVPLDRVEDCADVVFKHLLHLHVLIV